MTSTPDVIEVQMPQPINVVEVLIPSGQGPKGDTGNPGIIKSATEPPDPQENDLWLDIS